MGGFTSSPYNPIVANNVIAFNTAGTGDYSSALCVSSSTALPPVYNNIIYRNDGYGVFLGSVLGTYAYNDAWGNTADFDGAWGDPEGTAGNLSVDPVFRAASDDGDPSNDDFHLLGASPLIDAGDPSVLDADGSVGDLGGYGGPLGSW